MLWLARANATLVAVAAMSILLAPVQLVRWSTGREPFARTAPYLWLRYLFAKGTAFPGERPISRLSYEDWKRR